MFFFIIEILILLNFSFEGMLGAGLDLELLVNQSHLFSVEPISNNHPKNLVYRNT